jgi:hypothetical protein
VKRRSAALVFCLAASGCVDPGGRFHDFEQRRAQRPDAGVEPDAGSCSVAPGSVTGLYELSLSAVIAPKKPILAILTVSTPSTNGGTGLAFDAQPVSASDRKTPVGDVLHFGPFPIRADGGYDAALTNLRVTGAANPISGSDIVANVVLHGRLCGDGSFFCGTATGSVTAPLTVDLTGSTYTITRVPSAAELPAQPTIDCAKDLADPL